MNRGRVLRITLIILSFALTCAAVFTGEYFQTIEDIKVGSIAPKRFTSPREIENKLATEKKREQIRNEIEPLYKQEPQIEKQAETRIELLFNKVEDIQEYLADQKEADNQQKLHLTDELTEEERQNIVKETEDFKQESAAEQIKILQKQSPISLSDAQLELLVQMDSKKLEEIKRYCLEITQSTFSMGIREEAKTKIILDVKEQFESLNLEPEIQTLGYDIVSSVIQPNMSIDESATQKMLEERLSQVRPVIILPGQKIVDEGEIITEEAYQILESLGFIKKDFKEESVRYIGAILLICLLLSFIYIYIWIFNKSIMDSKKEMLLLCSIYSINILMIRFMAPLHFSWIPIPIAGMLLSILLDIRLGILFNGGITIIGALMNKESLDFIIFFLIVGTFFSILVMNTYKRNRILWVGILAGLLNGITIISLEQFLNGADTINILSHSLYAFISGVLSVIITVGSLPFWEVAFDVVTPIKLLELTNPEQPLLKRLLIEAPGTYYHSLIVANLAETAAADIEANSLLARVGGYYHDIGKIVYPQYFKENQVLDNPHDYMEPSVSAKIIHQHVSNGLKIAAEYKLPRAVKDMIAQHHGTTFTQYFYYKAAKINSAESISKEEFCYEGPIPQSKEAALIMLADTVEAAVRSMNPHEKITDKTEQLVRKLIKSKLDDGQLDDSNLTIKDLEKIVQAFMKVFNGMYHERIKYPDGTEDQNNEDLDGKQHIVSVKRENESINRGDHSTSA
ncbi:HDIG domain-containing metalloprotein [Defluviitalea saccharophila]|uniref:HDIG domain-containing protein n=1 Tax=Defluviitalea saccharophila TaxID=879970 RepID=A0ABZ2Y4M6_9FIRM